MADYRTELYRHLSRNYSYIRKFFIKSVVATVVCHLVVVVGLMHR